MAGVLRAVQITGLTFVTRGCDQRGLSICRKRRAMLQCAAIDIGIL
jgi:hypothetical protein